MRTRLLWLTALSVVLMGLGSVYAQDGVVNLLTNGGLEDGTLTGWGGYGDNTREVVTEIVGAAIPEDVIEGSHCLHVTVNSAGANFWDGGVQPSYGQSFAKGKKYTLSAWLKCDEGTRQINFKPELAQDPWTGYGAQELTMTDEWAEYHVTTPVMTEDISPAGITFHIQYGPGEFWMDYTQFYEGDYVPTVFGPKVAPVNPGPADGATDVAQDVVLSWDPGVFAAKHNVYFGTSFDDVNNGDASVLAGPGLTTTTFDPEGLLDFGQTYYWRVDEVNAPPSTSVFAGPVWSFTVEPYAYPIQSVAATASSSASDKGMTPGKTVDGSGMTGDQHSTQDSAMWLSSPFAVLPAWIQYEFGDVYKLHELWVWNSNQTVEDFLGFGAKDVTVEYSLDGVEWNLLGDVEFAQAPGEAGYAANTTVDMAGVVAKFVRLTIANNWKGIVQQVGLSEVRFYHIPVKASRPSPASGNRGVPLDVTLTWRSGREAVSHDVYFSDDRNAVVDGSAPVENVTTARFEPSGLEFGLNYYWKVNEVSSDGSVYEGDVWSLGTTEYMVVEDFESYDDDIDAGTTIFQTWIDGLTNGSGSVVGYWEAPFAETQIVHGGRQSMPMDYNNAISPYYSEAERTFDPVQNWTVNGADELSLWYHGYPVPFVENADGSITMSGSGHDIYDAADDFRFAYKPLNGDGSIVARVDSIGNTNDWAKAGVMIRESLMDDARCVYMVVTPVNGVEFGRRLFMGVTPETNAVAGLSAPQYVRLTRKGNVFTAHYSSNGTTWQEIKKADGTPVSIAMTGNPVIGLCVTSHDSDLVTTAEFSEITSSGTGPWRVAAVGDDPQPGNGTDDLYVVVQDSSNKSVTVTNPDPAAVNANAWTEWKIPLSDLAGVNLTKVKTMYIGVGDRDNPQADGAGRLFIDDIRVGRPAAVAPTIPGNLLTNGGFENGVVAPWNLVDNSGGGATAEVVGDDPIEGGSCLHVVVPMAGVNFWDIHLTQPGYVYEAGKNYTLSAWFKCASGTLDINFKPELAADPWTGYGEQVITITDEWAEYSVTTPVFAADTSPGSITFHCGFAPSEFWMDGVRFYEGNYVAADGSRPGAGENLIPNGGFEDGVLEPWNTYGDVTTEVVTELVGAAVAEAPAEGSFCLYVDVAEGVANFWEAGLQPSGEVFEAGKKYTISAFLKAKQGTLDVNFKPELGADPWTAYGEQMMTITDTWAEYSVTTPVFTENVSPASFTFHVGAAVGGFWVDGVRYYEGDYVPAQ